MTPPHHNVADLSDDECIAIAMVQYGVQFKEIGQGRHGLEFLAWVPNKTYAHHKATFGMSLGHAARKWLRTYVGNPNA